MPQVFHRSFNAISRVSILGFLFILAGIGFAYARFSRSDYVTGQDVVREQPVQFYHKHHVGGLGLDCRYCHSSVEKSAYAGIPATQVCMNCHSQIWTNSPELKPVHESFKTNKPIAWNRVHNLADFVYFDHSAHVNKGVGCSSCHGRVDEMPLIRQAAPLSMEWCLECHRQPEKFLRDKEDVFKMDWKPAANQLEHGKELLKKYGIRKTHLDDCSVCHR